jgi:hypothetical protein
VRPYCPSMAGNEQHLVIEVSRKLNNSQMILTPSQADLRTDVYDVSLTSVVALLDELGESDWRLVAVQDDRYWLARPTPGGPPRVHEWEG